MREIEDAVASLSREDLGDFNAWFEEFKADEWDREIEADAEAGKLGKLFDEALAHFKKLQRGWSVRIGAHYRALAAERNGEFVWVWIGPHETYNRLLD